MVLEGLTFIGVALLIGLLSSLIAKRLRLPEVLVLVFVGIVFGAIIRLESIKLSLPHEFITGLSIFTLILIIFESTAKIRFTELDIASMWALKLTGLTIALNLLFFAPAVWIFLFGGKADLLFMSFLFAAIMSGTSADVVLSILGNCKRKIIEVLKLESVVNTPLTIIIPLIVVSIMQGVGVQLVSDFIIKFIIQITSGIGAGVVVGLIVFKAMRTAYSETFSPIAVITAAVITYILAENIGGDGVLAVTTLGLFFGNLYIKQKISLLEFESLFSALLRILIFIIIGFLIEIPLSIWFFAQILILLAIYTVIRLIAVAFLSRNLSWKEVTYMALSAPKGITVVVITLAVLAKDLAGFNQIVPYILGFVLLSMILATAAGRFSKFFLGIELEQPVPKKRKK
jgi:cell volume regulation protein A